MWEAIAYVSSGFTLAAFVVAVIAWVLKNQAEKKSSLISLAKEDERVELVQSALEFFNVQTDSLTKAQKYDLALKQIHERANRFKTLAVLVGVLSFMAASLSAYAISELGGNPDSFNRDGDLCAQSFDQRPLDCNFK